uniref:Uncharacterized protein n=1 Tax=Panagrolaimus davidi TaxID=227884 RepID=A0A914PG81_9BILA
MAFSSSVNLHFKGPNIRQTWSLPDSIIYYIAKNPSNAKAWQKLIQCCKYFFAKNPILVIDELIYAGKGKWEAFLFSKAKVVYLHKSVVRNKNDETVPLEKLVKGLPKIKKINLSDNPTFSSITSNTVKELFKIPRISKVTDVILWKLPETFDLETFYIYFKKNKHTKFRIRFRDAISEAYKIRIVEIVDEIIATENHDYKIPNIGFDYKISNIGFNHKILNMGFPNEKWGRIDSLIRQQNKQ